MSKTLLPPNATALERALSLAMSMSDRVPVPVRDVWNADTCPPSHLPWLAWAYSVDQWNDSWSPEQKRDVIKRSISVHRRKGTIGAVQDALRAIGIGIRVQEWFNQTPEGDPYTYQLLLTTDQVGISQGALQEILQAVEDTKNLRSHLDAVKPSVITGSRLTSGGAGMTGVDTVVRNGVTDLSLLMAGVAAGFALVEGTVGGLHALVHEVLPQSWSTP